jgi:lysophospholipase L1-like esterase
VQTRASGGPSRAAVARGRGIARSLAPTLVFALLLGAGFGIGRHVVLRDLAQRVEDRSLAATLGRVLAAEYDAESQNLDDVRAEFARAYLDPAAAAADMDDYAWDVPVVPAPFVGYAPAPGRHWNATINEKQLRYTGELAVPKPDGVVRIFVTGGSTAFGSGAPAQDRTIPGYLQALLDRRLAPQTGRRYEVVNAASPAWTTTQERIWIANRIAELDPDLVVSFSGANDVLWAALGRDILWFRAFADEHYFRLIDGLRVRVGMDPLPDVVAVAEQPVPPRDVTRRLARNLRLASHALAAGGATYVFALQPTLATTGKALSERERIQRNFGEQLQPGSTAYFASCYRAIDESLTALPRKPFRYVDLSHIFDATGDGQEIFLDRFHFGDRGNEKIADELYRALLPALAESGA